MLEGISPVLSYRDDEGGLRFRRHELVTFRKAQVGLASEALVRIYARRMARIAGGATAMAGAGAVTFMSGLAYGMKALADVSLFAKEPPVTHTLIATVLLVPLAMMVAWLVARARMRTAIGRAVVSTDDVRGDVARLEHAPPLRRLTERLVELELPSVWVPLVGWALVAPLSMHLLLALVLGWVDVAHVDQFDWWILVSLVLMGIGHAVLCKMAVRFARRLRAWSPDSGEKAPSEWAAYGWTMLGACVPGVLLYVVPPLIAAVTSLFVPVTFAYMKNRILTERAILGSLED